MTYNLRKGVKFHDGSELNATVVKWNLENVKAAKQAPNWSSVDIIDDYTVRINLSKFQNTMWSGFNASMISKAAFDNNSLDWVRQNPVGTGPYKFVSYEKDATFTGIKNPDYWREGADGKPLPYLDGVKISFIPDSVTQESAMLALENAC
jgi:peptide/nickel transport system substrate-binding protein